MIRCAGLTALTIEADRVGFEMEARPNSPGWRPLGMYERAALAGGNRDVASSPGHDATIIARFHV